MRILILNRVEPPAPGATGRLIADLAPHLREQGHEVEVISTGKLPPKIIPYLLSWLSIGLGALLARRADCVVVMSDPPMLALWIPFLKKRHGRIIYWCQDLYPDLFPIVGVNLPDFIMQFLRRAKKWALKKADQVITLSGCMKDKLLAYADNITIIPNWPERDIEKNEVSEAEPLTVLYAGNIGMVHPIDAIVTAIQSCRRMPVKFILMTGGKGEAILRGKLAGQNNVTFLPPQPWERAKTIQSMCHLHLIGLRDDALGLAMPVKTYAAIQNGRPYIFIGPDACEAARLIHAHGCGEVLRPADAVNFARIIQDYSNADGMPNEKWRTAMQKTRDFSLLDGFAMIAGAITSG